MLHEITADAQMSLPELSMRIPSSLYHALWSLVISTHVIKQCELLCPSLVFSLYHIHNKAKYLISDSPNGCLDVHLRVSCLARAIHLVEENGVLAPEINPGYMYKVTH